MADYYEILGLDRSATTAQIRVAYKRLAMQYHPDRNAGDKEAEEFFKQVNEAYHVLSDSLKKARYDSALFVGNPEGIEAELEEREQRRRRYYKMRHAQQNTYTIDRNYFKVQALAFLAFFVMAGVCFGIAHLISYFFQQHQLDEVRKLNSQVHEVNSMFNAGKVEEAFKTIGLLKETAPFEVRYMLAHDSLIGVLRTKAENHYAATEYAAAISGFLLLQKLEDPVRKETVYMISRCQFFLGNYAESKQALKHLHTQDPRNLQLIYSIATLNHQYLDLPEEALQYFTMGKKLFRENMTEIYGKAFEMSLDPQDAPDIYYEMYAGSARLNIQLQHFTQAIDDSNIAIYLRRNLPEGYTLKMEACAANKDYGRLCETIPDARAAGANVDTWRRYCR